MSRIIPGSAPVEGREYLYVESENTETFAKVFPTIVPSGRLPMPKHGGMVNENAVMKLPDGRLLHGLSYKGDLEGWRRSIVAGCENLGILWGEITGQRVKLSNGQEYPLDACVVDFY